MNPNIKKLLVMAFALFIAVFCVSCGDEQQDTQDTESAAVTESEEIPEVQFDLGGETLRVLNHRSTSWNTLLVVTEQDGDILNDAIYTLNRSLEDRLNFTFDETNTTTSADGTEAKALAEKSILAGEDSYDLIMMTDRDCLIWAQNGMLLSMYDLPYVNLENQWWSPDLSRDISIGNKLYFAYGDFNLTAYSYTYALIFNKDIHQSFGFDDLYAMVNSGDWTLNRMAEMMVDVTADLNGDSIMDLNDRFGFTAYGKAVLPNFWIPAGLKSISKDSDDLPVISMGEEFISYCTKIYEIMYDQGVYIEQPSDSNPFTSGNILFSHSTFNSLTNLRDVEFDFGILPFPKSDEKQDKYYSRTGGGAFTVVPVTAAERTEMISIILEEWAREARDTLIPVYYETVLKVKVARDEDSLEMLDIIFDNRIYDLGDTYWNPLIRDGFLRLMFMKNDRALVSAVESNRPAIEEAISATVKAFGKLK